MIANKHVCVCVQCPCLHTFVHRPPYSYQGSYLPGQAATPLCLLLLLLLLQATPLLPELLQHALDLVLSCPCTYPRGCPCCVQHLDCKNYNAVLSKKAGVQVLRAALEQERAHAELGRL